MTEKKKTIPVVPPKCPILIGGIPQNVFVLRQRKDFSTIPTNLEYAVQEKYPSLERKNLSNGYTEEVVIKDYPINPDSVTSYADAADYRNDPLQAIAQAPKRVNLGDISEVQQFCRENPQQAIGQYAEVLQKVTDYFKAQAEKGAEAPSGQSPAGGDK